MNGQERKELITLKVLMEERWKNHDKRSEEIWTEIRGNIKGIFGKLDNLLCKTHSEKLKNIETRVNWLYFVFVIAFVGGIVMGLWIRGVI